MWITNLTTLEATIHWNYKIKNYFLNEFFKHHHKGKRPGKKKHLHKNAVFDPAHNHLRKQTLTKTIMVPSLSNPYQTS